MLIGEESPLRSLPSALNKRQLRMLNGIRYSIEMYDIAYRSLLHTLTTIDSEQDNQKDDRSRAIFPSVLLHAWSMVDTANRLRELLKHTPGLPRRDPHFRANLRML